MDFEHYTQTPLSNGKSTRTVRHTEIRRTSSTYQNSWISVYLEFQPQPFDQHELTLPPWEILLLPALEVALPVVFEM